MTSSTERPFDFFTYFINNFNEISDRDFYIPKVENLNIIEVDKNKGIITYFDDINSRHSYYRLDDYFNSIINKEIENSKKLVGDNVRKLISTDKNPKSYLMLIQKDIIALYNLSRNLNNSHLNNILLLLIKEFSNNYAKYISFENDFTLILNKTKNNSDLKKKIVLSFEWNINNHPERIVSLYNKLITANPPFIECEYTIFEKAFTGKELFINEQIQWLCKNVKNKNVISKVTLIRFIETLYEKQYIKNDKNDFNKIIENIFVEPKGGKIKNIKESKASISKSKSPSRWKELYEIINSLT